MWGMFRMEYEHVHVTHGSQGGLVPFHIEQTNSASDGNEDLKVAVFHFVLGILALFVALMICVGIILGLLYQS
jgi:RsiW-degrading membrane proteinase PrsW (M82 family)